MAAVNKLLFDAINDPGFKTKGSSEQERTKALDALLAAGDDPVLFRKAVLDHLAFWKQVNKDIKVPEKSTFKKTVGYFLGETPLHQTDEFLSAVEKNPDFKTIQQAAAEQRVKSSLTGAEPAVLVGILQKNTGECRDYLEQKKVLQVPSVHGGESKNYAKNQEILTNAAIANYQKEAANLLLLKILNAPEVMDPKLFADLIDAKNSGDLNRIKTAAKALATKVTSIQGSGILENFLTAELSDAIITRATERKNQLEKSFAEHEFKRKLQDFENTHKNEALLGKKDLLKKGDTNLDNFFDELLKPDELKENDTNKYKDTVRNFTKDEKINLVKDAYQSLCANYMQAKLLTVNTTNKADLVAVLKAPDKAQLKTALEKYSGADEKDGILKAAVTDDIKQNNLLKIALVKNFTKKLTTLNDIKKLEEAKDVKEFRQKLAEVIGQGITSENLDCVTDNDLKDLKRSLRLQLFQLEVDKASRLGVGAHQELIKIFAQLPDAKQVELLKNPKNLSFVINAQSREVIKHYLGTNGDDGKALSFDAVVTENKRLAIFKEIYNSEIAKILANYQPSIHLDQAKVDVINRLLVDSNNTGLEQLGNYSQFIKNLCTTCGVPDTNKSAFYQAFGLDGPGTNVNDQSKITPIVNQHTRNKSLLTELAKNNLPEGEKKLYGILARAEKTQDYSNPQDSLGHIKSGLCDTADKFFDSNKNGPMQDQVLKNALSKELTEDVFSDVKNDIKKDTFKSSNDLLKMNLLNEVKEGLKKIHKTNHDLHKHVAGLWATQESGSKKIDFEKIDIHAALQGKSIRDINVMKARYVDIDKQCFGIIAHLTTSLKEVDARLKMLQENLNSINDEKAKKLATTLIKDLENEKKEIEEQLGWYKKVKTTISNNILPGIEKARADAERYVYAEEGFKVYLAKRTNLAEETLISNKQPQKNTGIVAGGRPPVNENKLFLLTGKPSSDQVIRFEMTSTKQGARVVTTGDANTQPQQIQADVDIHGSYTYDANSPDAAAKYEVTQFPEPRKGELVRQQDLEDERVKFAMSLAINVITNMDPPPSKDNPIYINGLSGKEEEVKYLWTAFAILGDKMGFSTDAIRVTGTANFDPENERKSIFKGGGFSDGSFYKEVFASREPLINTYVDKVVQKIKDKEDSKETIEKMDEAVAKKQHSMKDEVKAVRETGEANMSHGVSEAVLQNVGEMPNPNPNS